LPGHYTQLALSVPQAAYLMSPESR
jgi:hypothetical protein